MKHINTSSEDSQLKYIIASFFNLFKKKNAEIINDILSFFFLIRQIITNSLNFFKEVYFSNK